MLSKNKVVSDKNKLFLEEVPLDFAAEESIEQDQDSQKDTFNNIDVMELDTVAKRIRAKLAEYFASLSNMVNNLFKKSHKSNAIATKDVELKDPIVDVELKDLSIEAIAPKLLSPNEPSTLFTKEPLMHRISKFFSKLFKHAEKKHNEQQNPKAVNDAAMRSSQIMARLTANDSSPKPLTVTPSINGDPLTTPAKANEAEQARLAAEKLQAEKAKYPVKAKKTPLLDVSVFDASGVEISKEAKTFINSQVNQVNSVEAVSKPSMKR